MCCYAIVTGYLFIKLVDVVRHHCSAGVTLLWLIVKSCYSFSACLMWLTHHCTVGLLTSTAVSKYPLNIVVLLIQNLKIDTPCLLVSSYWCVRGTVFIPKELLEFICGWVQHPRSLESL